MKNRAFTVSLVLACFVATAGAADSTAAKENVFETKPLGIKVSIKMIGPYTQPADLQIICLFKHKSSGDTYQGAAKETDAHLGGILSALRNRGEFVGELGETFLFTPPEGTIPAKRFMVIGLGDEKDLSLDSLRLVGRIAAREAVRLKPATLPGHRSFATKATPPSKSARVTGLLWRNCFPPTTRKSGSRHKGSLTKFSIEDVVIEAGPSFFDSAVKQGRRRH
jgi:hypothetical protein